MVLMRVESKSGKSLILYMAGIIIVNNNIYSKGFIIKGQICRLISLYNINL